MKERTLKTGRLKIEKEFTDTVTKNFMNISTPVFLNQEEGASKLVIREVPLRNADPGLGVFVRFRI